MKEKNKLILEKSITRDWCLMNAELHRTSFTTEFFKEFSWSFSEVIYEGVNNTITVYYPPHEYFKGMMEFIISQLNIDPNWMNIQANILKKQIEESIIWINKIKSKKISDYSNQELIDIFEKFIKININSWHRFIIILMFPIQMENRKDYNEAVQIAIKTRIKTEKFGPIVDSFFYDIGKEVLIRSNLSEKFARYLSCDEVLNYLKKNKIPSLNMLKQREKYFIVTKEGILTQDIKDYSDKKGYILKTIDFGSEIKGKIAFQGVIRGKTKIIQNKEEFNKLESGNILVTNMTTPDYISIMKKAGAIVTDEGGITSHAAIVSRELKKPCIINTKIATKVLKDGDLVEVDADKGIVKILEKANI